MDKIEKNLLGKQMWYAKSDRDASTSSTTGLTALWHDPEATPEELLSDLPANVQPEIQYLKLEQWQAYQRPQPHRGTGVRAVIDREYVREDGVWQLVSSTKPEMEVVL